jgi:hypothetical protein
VDEHTVQKPAQVCAYRQLAASARSDLTLAAASAIARRSAMGSLFSNFWTDFIGRFDGPLHFRLFAQPLMAILFALRDGNRDAREGRGAYLWSLVTDPSQRRCLLESGWKGISRVFILAFALDVVYQFVEWGGLKPLQALLTAVVLAVIPYALLRGPVNRLMRMTSTRSSPASGPPTPRSGGAR